MSRTSRLEQALRFAVTWIQDAYRVWYQLPELKRAIEDALDECEREEDGPGRYMGP